jgi:hypothetical protein
LAIGAVEGLLHPLGLDLNLQDDLAIGDLLGGNLHGPSGRLQM